jgi:hypothetical protein
MRAKERSNLRSCRGLVQNGINSATLLRGMTIIDPQFKHLMKGYGATRVLYVSFKTVLATSSV